MEIGTTFKPAKQLTTYIRLNIYNYKISGGLDILGTPSTVNISDAVYSINTNLAYDITKNWNVQGNLNYLSARPTAQGEDSRFFNPNISLRKKFGNGKYTMGFQ